MKLKAWLLATMLLFSPLMACNSSDNPNNSPNPAAHNNGSTARNSLLDLVTSRGNLVCGVHGQLPGFSFVDENGKYSGLDVDFCRAIAAALFDNPDQVVFRDLNTQDRFTALQSGEVDVLSRNTTWTLSRDTSLGTEAAPVLFYDGQGIMVKKRLKIGKLQDLKAKTICVQAGTTTELNLAEQMQKRGINYQPVVFDDADAMYSAYEQERCQGISSDRSQLVSRRAIMAKPDAHIVLDAIISKEPLAPMVADGDAAWFDTVKWVTFALIQAEEFGITSTNIAQFQTSKDPNIRRFLGLEGTFGADMGLSNDFALRIIRHVGNYGEIYERNIGKPLGLDRGLNKLWTNGGLLYSPPFR